MRKLIKIGCFANKSGFIDCWMFLNQSLKLSRLFVIHNPYSAFYLFLFILGTISTSSIAFLD